MTIAVLATVAGRVAPAGIAWVAGALVVGGVIGIFLARTVKMTQMPELVAFMHSLVGLVAMLVVYASYFDPTASSGMSGAETLFALGMTLVHNETIGIGRLFELLATNPARVLGLEAGTLDAGMPADLILIDPNLSWQIQGERMVAKAANTPFEGLPVQGKVVRMWKGGTEIL